MAKDLRIGALLDVYGAFLSEKKRTVTEHYYFDDLSLSEIAENEGITRQAVRDIIRRTELQLEKFENECGYYKKFTLLKSLSSDIQKNSEEIKTLIEEL